MSQTMIPALSDSPLLTLSVGTLPASKPGMMLDANPFASHLARMSGPETAISGPGPIDAPAVAGPEGGFALALVQGLVPATPVAAASATLAEVLQPAETIATFADVPELPEDASTSQVIEALMGGAAAASAQAQIAPATVVAPPPVQVISPATSAPVAPDVSETMAADGVAAEPHAVRPRRPARPDGQSVLAGDPVPVAAPMIAPAAQPPLRPEAYAPDTGNRRAAISAMPAPATSSPEGAVIEAHGTGSSDILAGAASADAPDGVTHLPAPRSAQTGQFDAGEVTAQPARPADSSAPAAPTPAARSAEATRPARTEAPGTTLPVSGGPAAESPASGPAAVAEPVGTAGSPATPQPAAWVPAAIMASLDPAATSVRAAALRSIAPAAGQRSVQPALHTARPVQVPGALLDGVDPAAKPALDRLVAASGLDTVAALPAESVPPSWAAALNAIISPAANASQGLVASAPTGNGPTGHLETLAFDAGFIGNVETQIASVAGGGQMVRMQIMPEHLGRIDIEMLAGPERDQIRITTEHDAVRDTLIQSQVRLEQDLRSNSHRVADVTVELRQQSAGAQGGSAQQQRGQAGPETAGARDAAQRQAAADTTADSKSAQRRPRDNVRYA